MTKCIIIGEKQSVKKQPKPIRFEQHLTKTKDGCVCVHNSISDPSEYENVELICRMYNYLNKDLMFAYNSDRNYGMIYIGKWNDGVVKQ